MDVVRVTGADKKVLRLVSVCHDGQETVQDIQPHLGHPTTHVSALEVSVEKAHVGNIPFEFLPTGVAVDLFKNTNTYITAQFFERSPRSVWVSLKSQFICDTLQCSEFC